MTLFSSVADLAKRKGGDLLVIPFWEGQKKPTPVTSLDSLANAVKAPIEAGDFRGGEGESSLLYLKGVPENRVLLLGLGRHEKLSVDLLRRAFSLVTKQCHKLKVAHLNVMLPTISQLRTITVEQCLEGVCQGILLTNYQWNLATQKETGKSLLKQVTLVGIRPSLLSVAKESILLAEGVYLARDLINGNADDVTPAYLAATAQKIGKQFPSIKTKVYDKKWLEKEKCGLLLAVGRGSPHEPKLIIMNHAGNPRSIDHTVIVGKGITFDTGGLNLKPTGSIEAMRDDMSGAAAALAAVATAASLGLKVNVTAVVPAAENAIDGKSFKPGDLYLSHAGKTVEVGNTDAEGRLVLADALSYALSHLHPTRMIDLATLTGSMVVALGEEISGVFSNDDTLAASLLEAGKRTDEILWRMPLYPPYKEKLKSDIADLKNIGGRPAGAITAALFLEEFVASIPWAHIDIAGTAFASKEQHYLPKNGTGFGVRLLVDFLKTLEK